MTDRWERLWRDYWAETHKPDANGKFYWDREGPSEPAPTPNPSDHQHPGEER